MKSRLPIIALAVFMGLTSVNWSPDEAGILLSDPAALQQHGTEVAAVTDQKFPPGKNVLWCATFQMAWDEAAKHFGSPLRLKPSCKLADSLNRQSFDRRWVDDGSIFTASGRMNEGILDRIDEGSRKMRGHRAELPKGLRKSMAADDLVFFAALHKQLEFPRPFGKLGTWQMGGKKVRWFGFAPDAKDAAPLRQQVKIHHYDARNDFVIELSSKETGDQLLLAKLPKAPTSTGEISREVLVHLGKDAPPASAADLLAVPNVSADQLVEFPELHGKTVIGSNRFIRKAWQSIHFLMDEKGVKLDSDAGITFGCAASPHIKPRLIILDPPFALLLKRGNAPAPYFVAWFANTDLLE